MRIKLSAPCSAPVLLALLAGCQSTGVDTTKATVASLQDVRNALSQSENKVDNVVNSLNSLADAEGDMTAPWRNYVSAVSAVEADSARVTALRNDAKTSKANYLRSWEERMKSIKDADLRKRAEERRDAATKELDELGTAVDEAREKYASWMTNVTDIRTYLESDLNPAGVQSVADKIKSVDEGAASLKKELNDVVGELDQVIASMNTVAPQAEGAENK